jgi:hypothetical protein
MSGAFVAPPFVATEDGIAAGEAAEGFHPVAVAMRAFGSGRRDLAPSFRARACASQDAHLREPRCAIAHLGIHNHDHEYGFRTAAARLQ